MKRADKSINFRNLVASIRKINTDLQSRATKAVNLSLTLRNWLIGMHIAEYELRGKDRSKYGDKLIDELADRLADLPNCNRRQMYRYLDFYRCYPQIVGTLSPQFKQLLPKPAGLSRKKKKVGTMSPQLHNHPEQLLRELSYSHFELLTSIESPEKRLFYETECLRAKWDVRLLRRQIYSLYYERSGLSKNKSKLARLESAGTKKTGPALTVRDPYVFEFLGIKPKEVVRETALEDALLDKLQEFLIELGHGFCFEARQKRILIDGEHFFADLVFYHRILKCHVLIELKVDEFKHEYLGQLNTYLNWFRANETATGDNPPVGILLCTHKNQALVEYALAGMKNQLFVSRYQVQLPKKEQIQRFIERQLREKEMER